MSLSLPERSKDMRVSKIGFFLFLMAAAVLLGAENGYNLFQKGLAKERVEMDLKSAVRIYEQVVRENLKDHKLAAQALFRIGECKRALGDAEARKAYERIVREFADQVETVAQAQARLGGPTVGANSKGDRAVWTGPKVDTYGRVSADGRFITYVDWNNGSLMLRDLSSGMDRVLTPPGPPNYTQYASWSVMSADAKQVVYGWQKTGGGGGQLRLASLQGSGFLEPREVYRTGDQGIGIGSLDFSADGKWIVAVVHLRDGADQTAYQIALIAAANGSSKILSSGRTLGCDRVRCSVYPHNIFFSPDSRYIAYDLPADPTTQQRDVFVLAINGTGGGSAIAHDAKSLMGWSPDGARLLYSSERFGSVGLMALPFADGRAQGKPELVKSDIGSNVPLGVTASGALYVAKTYSSRDIAIAPIDLESGKLLGPPVDFSRGFMEGARVPIWSPDGKYLAYPVACNNGCIAIRSVATGQARRLAATLIETGYVSWSPDGRRLVTTGKDVMGRTGVFQIDAQSGEATPLILNAANINGAQWSPDGKKLYFTRNGDDLVEWDVASRLERSIYKGTILVFGQLSPDGKYVVVARPDPSAKTASLLLVSIGGESRELLPLSQSQEFGDGASFTWTPDSSAVIFDKKTGTRRELWRVPITGGQPQKLDIDPELWIKGSLPNKGQLGFRLSPDGHSIAFQMGGTAVPEVWALENFLPTPKPK
jgi:Tol biopolymer transport system component